MTSRKTNEGSSAQPVRRSTNIDVVHQRNDIASANIRSNSNIKKFKETSFVSGNNPSVAAYEDYATAGDITSQRKQPLSNYEKRLVSQQ